MWYCACVRLVCACVSFLVVLFLVSTLIELQKDITELLVDDVGLGSAYFFMYHLSSILRVHTLFNLCHILSTTNTEEGLKGSKCLGRNVCSSPCLL